MAPIAIFGITNDGLNLAVNLLLLFLVVLWLALVYWTYADAKRRIPDSMLVGCATAAALFPFVGTIVYLVVRPPEYLEDVHERELEIAAAEARLAAVQQEACPYCEHPVERAFLRCPSCLRRLKEPCATCGKPLDPRWSICPYCEAEVPERKGGSQRRGGGGRRRERPPDDERRRERPAGKPSEREPSGRESSGRERSGRERPSAGERPPGRERPASDERTPAARRERPVRQQRPPDEAEAPTRRDDQSDDAGDEPRADRRPRPADTTEVKRPGGRPARQ